MGLVTTIHQQQQLKVITAQQHIIYGRDFKFGGGIQRYSFILLHWYYYVNPYENYSFDGMQKILRIVSFHRSVHLYEPSQLCLISLMVFIILIFVAIFFGTDLVEGN